jgi:hypothetical protein
VSREGALDSGSVEAVARTATLDPAAMLNRMVLAHGTGAMCQFLGGLDPTAAHHAAHICGACMPFALTLVRADDTDCDPF